MNTYTKIFSNKKAFTLVELIVVITILAILGTIAFVSFTGYTKNSRDTARLADLNTIRTGLELTLSRGGQLPIPDNKINITANGEIISYQGYAGLNVLQNIGMQGGGKDPLDGEYYTYTANLNLNKYQIMGFLEGNPEFSYNSIDSIISKTVALTDYSQRYPTLKGSELGIFTLSGSKTPAQVNGTTIDLVNTAISYDVFLNNSDDIISGTGNILSSILPNANCKRIKNLTNTIKDGNYIINPTGKSSFEVYCDMNTNGGGRTRTHLLKYNALISNSINYRELFSKNKIFGLNGFTNSLEGFDYDEFAYLTNNSKINIEFLDSGTIRTVGNKNEGFSYWKKVYTLGESCGSFLSCSFPRISNWYYYTSLSKEVKETLTIGNGSTGDNTGYWSMSWEKLLSGNNGTIGSGWGGTNFPFGKRSLSNNWCYGGKNNCWKDNGQQWASLWLR